MLEWKLLAMLDENPQMVHSFEYKRHSHLLFQEFFDMYLNDFFKVNEYNKCY